MTARYGLGAWLYVRALGAVLAIAFVSFWVQMEGLVGERGIVPAAELVARLDRASISFLDHPTLVRLAPGDAALHALCAAGVTAALLVAAGVLPRLFLLVCWALYLSIVNAGFPFTAFQWDTLLLEATFVSAFVAPLRLFDRPDRARDPDPVARWLVWLLVFRFMFRSGAVKLMSGDPTWASLTALEYHYETQPLPTPLAWYAHWLPSWVHASSAAIMFVTELLVPFLIFVPFRWARRTVAASFAGLMVLIAVTGNYGFFNLLTIALCIALLDDALLARILPWRPAEPEPEPRDRRRRVLLRAAAGTALALGALVFLRGFTRGDAITSAITRPLAPFHTFNNYGLFAVMTTERPEIVIEGSRDGTTWEPYVFRYKPGDPDRRPTFSQPHMPRLDWQMWFAALGTSRQNPWLLRFMQRLAEGEETVIALLEEDPFAGDPPRHVRAVLYDYRFTDFATRERTGAWWSREEVGLYARVVRD